MYKKEEVEITYNLTHSENSQLTFYYISIWFCFWGVVYHFDRNYTLRHVCWNLLFLCPAAVPLCPSVHFSCVIFDVGRRFPRQTHPVLTFSYQQGFSNPAHQPTIQNSAWHRVGPQ